jgi:hypothetical protein
MKKITMILGLCAMIAAPAFADETTTAPTAATHEAATHEAATHEAVTHEAPAHEAAATKKSKKSVKGKHFAKKTKGAASTETPKAE